MPIASDLDVGTQRLLRISRENTSRQQRNADCDVPSIPQNRIPMERLTWFIVLLLE